VGFQHFVQVGIGVDAGLPGQEQVEIGGFARLGDAAVQVDEGFEVVVLGSRARTVLALMGFMGSLGFADCP
jgi:hypothetical protein